MKIVVTVKQVPDPNSNLTLEADNTISREKEVVLDPGDECGVEEGLQLKEAHGGEVILVSMGPERAKDAIRKGLSMGADRGVLITDPSLAGADALLTARVLAAAIKKEEPDLVICATESYDGSTGMVPPMLAELLGFPQLTFAKKVEIDGSTVKVHRQTADGYQVVEAATPALITVTAAIASTPSCLSAKTFARWATWFDRRVCPSPWREMCRTSTPPSSRRVTGTSP